METIFEKIAYCVEVGKINAATPYPPTMKGEDGADELTAAALAEGYSPNEVLTEGLIAGMNRTGVKFKENKVFVPQVLMSAKAMSSGMNHLKKYFADGSVKRKGKFIVGTVQGDLHDIGKNLVCMMVEGNGYEVIDLGVDVSKETFVEAVRKNPDAFVGMSALLTTTMVNMGPINEAIKAEFPKVKTFVGGAPVNGDFAQKIGVDYYTEEPQKLVEILNRLAAN
ncbi:cobalamin-binding protein [Parabacteroides sp. TM07-1AC]|jgi:5-methyltetrahydrofolate--homocysteine methyltransferase|uniref:corrinoid protein n=1 Tax=Parabacteroides sp. TM07-1AC TaxID=2292363 RepID=UPI000EFE477F|nr:corrinoid protein [Parabacteroides sp. TM07-1AC]RHU26162.1 cobalamin-binding protein [Parabacteroides sp. TM07-1AC]